jgi:hypothetical protein
MRIFLNASAQLFGFVTGIALIFALPSVNPSFAQSSDPRHVVIPQAGVPLVPGQSMPVPAPATPPSVAAQAIDLSGIWSTQTGATFYVRQIGSQIWWYGTQSLINPRWTNVASGEIYGNAVRVHWVDVPQGTTASSGNLTLTAVDSRHLIVSENPDRFLSADWFR